MRPNVLVVDDNPVNQQLIQWALEDSADVHVSADGRDVLARALSLDAKVVFLDLMMPGVSGFDVIEQLRREMPQLLQRTIVISAQDDPETRRRVMAAGIAAFQKKPLEIDDVLRLFASMASS
ncbi:MAG TPA: response regulator [Vitreimonas sp.]|uniref:response regulator n=1 Tax=Vitreimonas sp. TaxID=3069702 RepID=UPI002D249D51|nr:response regulator [Vitreimonas sp.]HYD86739.1 response regulator [Vitreimonas sp.]